MKNLAIIIFAFIIVSSTYSQTDPKSFLSKIPSLPDNPCSMKRIQRAQYLDMVDKLDKEMLDEIKQRKQVAETNVKNSQDQIKQHFAKESGLSEADMQKLSNKKKLSEAEKNALIDKMLKEKANLSLEEVKKLKKMSKEGKQAWAEGYATEQMANGQANQDSNKTKKNMQNYELAKEQSFLAQKLAASDNKYLEQIKELDEKDTLATRELEASLKPLQEELNSINDGEGSTAADAQHAKNIINQIRPLEKKYCNKMTPDYYNILSDRLTYIKSSLPDYKRYEEVNSELTKATTGIDKDLSAPGMFELQAIEGYVSLLKTVFKYVKDSYPED